MSLFSNVGLTNEKDGGNVEFDDEEHIKVKFQRILSSVEFLENT